MQKAFKQPPSACLEYQGKYWQKVQAQNERFSNLLQQKGVNYA
jgi:hypothetical protein